MSDATQNTMPVALAPMEGLTAFPSRLWLTWVSQPSSMTTPFLRVNRMQAAGGLPRLFAPELGELRGVFDYELVPQFLSADPEGFLRAAALLDDVAALAIELNCGCPCPTCIGRYAGSGILAEPDVFASTLAKIAGEIGAHRFAVKMRLGYADEREFDGLLAAVAPLRLARLSVHGRTRAAGYKGRACWSAIERAARRAAAPTWGSGDVLSASTLADVRRAAPSAAGAMIGRGAIRNPWLFEELRRQKPVELGLRTLANALLSFALVHELAIFAPDKLMGKLVNDRLTTPCCDAQDAWKDRAAALSSLLFGAPIVITTGADLSTIKISPTTFSRLKILWAHLRTSLPASFSAPRLARAKSVAEFFALFFAAGIDDSTLTLCHREEWDVVFSGNPCTPRRERAEDDTAVERAANPH